MGEYHDRRGEIKGLLAIQSISAEEQRSGAPLNPVLNQLLADEAGRLLDGYERLTVEYLKAQSELLPKPPTYTVDGFLWGMLQSVAASFVFLLIVYAVAGALKASGIDLFAPVR